MNIIVVTTGDEIMQGIIVDTNTAWISERCRELGHDVIEHISVGDDPKAIGDTLKLSASNAGCVIVSGGLGPTSDDLTIDAAAKAFGVKIQAMVPEGGRVLPNKIGTAPGIQIRFKDSEFFFLPGVPKELYQIFNDSIIPWLKKHSSSLFHSVVLRCFGLPEATIDTKLREVDLSKVRLSFRVKFPEILLKLSAEGSVVGEESVAKAVSSIKEVLGDVVYGSGDAGMPAVLGGLLVKKKMTMAVAESCTGGLISNVITDVPGSSEYFERGVVSYSNKSKQEILEISEETIRGYGAVSAETARAMAKGVKNISGADIGLAVTGVAGPGGGTPGKPVGTVYIAYETHDKKEDFKYLFTGNRVEIKQMTAMTAIDIVRRYLIC